ncbi:acetoacetate decarboxylase family protein [Halorientalis brevis]|uniref:Acetoacetate decarboxylase family protein n=1 Tax=Halorientalis brevis TaxID=1126241 RepID=A0ABD6CCB0_9EURY|nr:acetoacetate decarboxylase family protein [Halorientalis brevis]
MVLQGKEGFAPPFDASLYGVSESPRTRGVEYEIEYKDCEAVAAFFTIDGSVDHLLPEGIEPFSEPAKGGVLVARYPFSNLGAYHEEISIVQVADDAGNMAYYIPYIYVTNDAAMAAGRELIGAPKKIADVDLQSRADTIQGTLSRPEDTRLLSVSHKPEKRAQGGIVDAILPTPTPLLSVRHVPPIEGGDGLTQLVKWYAEMEFHEDDDGREMWVGPTDVTYDAESVIDPVHSLSVDEVLTGFSANFDMKLGVTGVERDLTVER